MSQKENRFFNVLNDLQLTNSEIAKVLEVDASYISKLTNGTKPVTNAICQKMFNHYQVNPKYLRGVSDAMYDTKSMDIAMLTHFAKKITVALDNHPRRRNKRKKYLLLMFDENLIDLILNISEAKLTNESNTFELIRQKYEESYRKRNISNKEYVLIPRNDLMKIIADEKKKMPYLQEIIDTDEYTNFPDAQNYYVIKK